MVEYAQGLGWGVSMGSLWLTLLVVAVGADRPLAASPSQPGELFRCDFGPSCDQDFDHWPEGWARRRGPGFPWYLPITVQPNPNPHAPGVLRIELDGGAATAYSPPIPICPQFDCLLEVYCRTQGLRHDGAMISLGFLDSGQRPLEVFQSERVQQAEGWQKIRLGPVGPASPLARLAVIGLCLEPQVQGGPEDLRGSVEFTDVRLHRRPRIILRTGQKWHLFAPVDAAEIRCHIQGCLDPKVGLRFELDDTLGHRLAQAHQDLSTEPASDPPAAAPRPDQGGKPASPPPGRQAKAHWKAPLSGAGFYRVSATLELNDEHSNAQTFSPGGHAGETPQDAPLARRDVTLAVLEPLPQPIVSEFGWTLPRGDKPGALDELGPLLAQAGVRWVKYPLWFSAKQAGVRLERLLLAQDRLATRGIEVVGMICDPPAEVRSQLTDPHMSSAADVFTAAPQVWTTSLEPIFSRLGGRIEYWQLGDDRDTSFVGCEKLPETVARVKTALDRYGRGMRLGIGWDWSSRPKGGSAHKAPWDFLVMSGDTGTLASRAADTPVSRGTDIPLCHLCGVPKTDKHVCPPAGHWLLVEPPPRSKSAADVRAVELIERIVAAKMRRAAAVFLPDPFDPERGLLNPDGTPTDLLPVWRAAALLLGGAAHLGSLELPGGSSNQVFSRGQDAVMVVWNDRPTQESIWLGEELRRYDPWGRSSTPQRRERDQTLAVDRLPALVTGLNEPVARWRMDCLFDPPRILSTFDRPQRVGLRLKNAFGQAVSGQVDLVAPREWIVGPRQFKIALAGQQATVLPVAITLPPDVTCGRHMIRIDFQLEADRAYRFSAYRHLDVGLEGIRIEAQTRLNRQDELEVEQAFINEGRDRGSFRCELFAPERQRQRTDLVDQPPGRDVRVYRLPGGSGLAGRTLWLRAEEINGSRVLNYRLTAQR